MTLPIRLTCIGVCFAILWVTACTPYFFGREGGDGNGDYGCETVAERLNAETCSPLDEPAPIEDSGTLKSAPSCDGLVESFREVLVSDMRRRVEANYCAALTASCCWGGDGDGDGDCDGDSDSDSDSDGDSADEYSTTNTQEDGVDEADFIKNDGNYIYIIAKDQFMILNAWPADELSELSSFPINGSPRKLYVYNDRAVIYSYESVVGCYDEYDYQFGGSCIDPWQTSLITVLDISDRSQPVLERHIEFSGAYVDSRRIGNAIHTVFASPGVAMQNFTYTPSKSYCSYTSEGELRSEFDELIESNEQHIRETDIELFFPTVSDTRYFPDGSSETTEDAFEGCRNVYLPSMLSGLNFLTVHSVDVATPGPANTTSIIGQEGVVYSSRDALYVASIENPGAGDGREWTTVHRFPYNVNQASLSYQASGMVGGRVLNQFSMGESEGYLRMATTTGTLPDPDVYNSVYVLHPNGEILEVVGEVSPIAVSEDIRSARFIGDRGFVVTFKKTDPLFVIDLAEPESPAILGELHIPGYSTYMHMMDSDHILSIGFDAEE